MRTYLTKPIATEKYNLTPEKLEALIHEGVVTVYELESENGTQPIVYDDDLLAYIADQNITPEQFAHLRGNLISMSDAAEKYKIHQSQISQWLKQEVLKFHGWDRNRKLVDEADIAYMVTMMRAKKVRPGKKIFAKVS